MCSRNFEFITVNHLNIFFNGRFLHKLAGLLTTVQGYKNSPNVIVYKILITETEINMDYSYIHRN